ncbi:hypothetical protein G7K_3802-t1 [Saitoella complicata NRRL Y-17804]|uniref:Uncharacterized protein n=1 Tax=Saitoella complicata (strain BCRC 22490 / CBS 7301 / JCM 7358 / NBRC 10748 / NRRL Y-17804) TaxID=698492 RepID=A0A0E9NII1_SAICN|nr:hypothetical protein G7K_3802-t1 [Saitoella complicata NRRL Y-17804]
MLVPFYLHYLQRRLKPCESSGQSYVFFWCATLEAREEEARERAGEPKRRISENGRQWGSIGFSLPNAIQSRSPPDDLTGGPLLDQGKPTSGEDMGIKFGFILDKSDIGRDNWTAVRSTCASSRCGTIAQDSVARHINCSPRRLGNIMAMIAEEVDVLPWPCLRKENNFRIVAPSRHILLMAHHMRKLSDTPNPRLLIIARPPIVHLLVGPVKSFTTSRCTPQQTPPWIVLGKDTLAYASASSPIQARS